MPKTTLTPVQKSVITAGKALAKELGLKEFKLNKFLLQSVEFTEGQTALVVGPDSIYSGTFSVEKHEYSYSSTRHTVYTVKDAFYLRQDERKEDGKWVPSFKPELFMPAGAKLYVS